MAEACSIPSNNDKPVIVRVKRKSFQSPLEALWLEINERPVKRPLLDFGNLSISDSSLKVEELKTKKVLVQHVETVSNSEVTFNVLQSFVPDSGNAVESIGKSEERRRTFNTENKQDQLLLKAKQKQEVSSKNARFEQIWRSRKEKKEAIRDEALYEMCHLYDVVRVDDNEPNTEVQKQEEADLEDHRIMSSYLPLLREFIPSAAEEIEFDIHDYMSKQASMDDYVYDLYAVKDDVNISMEDASNPFPLIQVDDDDGFYDGPDESEFESDDSNAENNPLNEYPDEETSGDEENGSRTSEEKSEEHEGDSSSEKSSILDDGEHHNWFEDEDLLSEDEIYGDNDGGVYDNDDEDGAGMSSLY